MEPKQHNESTPEEGAELQSEKPSIEASGSLTPPETHVPDIPSKDLMTLQQTTVNSQSEPAESTINPPPSIMEVHHHGHVHDQKKWKEYVFQFLMLFLAVFCGFLAEYQLEHVIEHNREKQYMQSMAEDLQTDTLKMGNWLKSAELSLSKIDSSIVILINEDLNDSLADKLHSLFGPSLGMNAIIFTDRTSSQLKNSGGMRLVRNHNVAESILEYWNNITIINQAGEKLESYRMHGREMGFKILDRGAHYLKRYGISKKVINKQLLITKNPELLGEYANYLAFIAEQIRRSHRQDMINQHKQAVRLINLIRKEYKL